MLKKTTDELLGQLKDNTDINSYIRENEKYFIDDSISEHLNSIINNNNLVKAKVLKRAEINEIYGYQIFM